MISRAIALGTAAGVALLLAACGSKSEGGDAPNTAEAKPTAAAVKTAESAKTAAPAKAADAKPAEAKPADGQTDSKKYPMEGFKPVADTCKEATVVLASSPQKPAPKWVFIRAVLAAHQEFKVDGAGPDGATFTMAPTADNKSVTLMASCTSGATCNRLAATYKALVPTSAPQVYCGKVPGVKEEGRAVIEPLLPASLADTMEKCARIGTCARAMDPSSKDDPSLECQKTPAKFKLDCAAKTTCSAVAACTKG